MNRLERIASCEKFLKERGIQKFRIRWHDHLVRLELAPEEFQRFLDHEIRKTVVRRFQEIGFHSVSLDLQDFQSESFNSNPNASKGNPP